MVVWAQGNDQNLEKDDYSSVIAKLTEITKSASNRRALIIGIGLVLFQQLSGQPSVLYFANRIFETAGLGYEAALIVGVFKLAMTLVSAQLVEDPRFGRRALLLYGAAGILMSLVFLTALYGLAPAGAAFTQVAIVASLLLFVGSYQIGFGMLNPIQHGIYNVYCTCLL